MQILFYFPPLQTVFLGSIYIAHFRHFRDAFGDNMKVVTLEDFTDNPQEVRDTIFDFLGMRTYNTLNPAHV